MKTSGQRRGGNCSYAAAGLVAVVAIDRCAHVLLGDITLAPLVSVVVMAFLTLRLKPREIIFWTPFYALLSFLLLTYWRGSFVPEPGPLPPDVLSEAEFWRAVVRSFTVAAAGGLCAGLSQQRQKLQALLVQKKRATRELEEAQRSLEKAAYEVTENIPAGTYTMVQPPGGGMAGFSFLSTRFLEIAGLDRAATLENPLNAFGCVHPDDYEEWLRKNIHVFEHRLPFSEECRIVVAGKTRWIHAESNPRTLPDGSTVWEGVMSDITERKLAEENLAEVQQRLLRSEEKYRNFFNLPLIGTAITSRGKGWIEVNDRTCDILGYPREELFRKTWAEITHPEDLAADDEQFSRLLRREIDGYQIEKRFIRKDGTVVHTLLAGGCGLVGDKVPDIFYVNILDITERKKAETILATTNARMNLAARAARVGFWHFFVTENREEWDENLHAIYGSTPGRDSPRWENFLHPEDRAGAEEKLRAVLAKGGPYESEFRIVRPDGEVRHIRECGIVVQDKNGNAVTVTGADIDITAEKLAGQREREAGQAHRAELERKLKTSLTAAAVAHEINQPLSAILLDSRMALEQIKGDSRELRQARRFLGDTIARADRAVETIGKISSLLRSVQTAPQKVDLVAVVRSAELYAKDALREAAVTLGTVGADQAVNIRGDEGQLLLAVSNLLRNAIESIKSDDRQRKREILVSLRASTSSVVLAVGDSGAGLPGETLAKIPLNTTKPEGTGLGLFIVKSVAENHGATLEAGDSELGGAEVRLVFPAAQ